MLEFYKILTPSTPAFDSKCGEIKYMCDGISKQSCRKITNHNKTNNNKSTTKRAKQDANRSKLKEHDVNENTIKILYVIKLYVIRVETANVHLGICVNHDIRSRDWTSYLEIDLQCYLYCRKYFLRAFHRS